MDFDPKESTPKDVKILVVLHSAIFVYCLTVTLPKNQRYEHDEKTLLDRTEKGNGTLAQGLDQDQYLKLAVVTRIERLI